MFTPLCKKGAGGIIFGILISRIVQPNLNSQP